MINNKHENLLSDTKFDSQTNYKTECNNTKGIKLSSPGPFPDELKKFNTLYWILSIIFTILISKDLGIFLSILTGIIAAFIIINIIATFKIDMLKRKEFELPSSVSKNQIIDIITLQLTQLHMKVENLPDYIRITHNNMEYNILIDENKNTFKIWPQKKFWSSILSKVYIKLYKNAIISIPIIAYTIQSKFFKSTYKN